MSYIGLRLVKMLLSGVSSVFVLTACTPAEPPAETACAESAIGVSRRIDLDIDSPPVHDQLQAMEVVLTFDDGPHATRTIRVMNALASECVTAVFFLKGDEAEKYPAIVEQIRTRGHQVGSHTYSHARLTDLSTEDAHADIMRGIAAIKATDPAVFEYLPVKLFRYPYLASSPELDAFLIANDLIRVDVSSSGRDWSGIDGSEIIDNVMAELVARDKRGVILLHDPAWATSHSVGRLLERLKADGYSIVAIQAAPVETSS